MCEAADASKEIRTCSKLHMVGGFSAPVQMIAWEMVPTW